MTTTKRTYPENTPYSEMEEYEAIAGPYFAEADTIAQRAGDLYQEGGEYRVLANTLSRMAENLRDAGHRAGIAAAILAGREEPEV